MPGHTTPREQLVSISCFFLLFFHGWTSGHHLLQCIGFACNTVHPWNSTSVLWTQTLHPPQSAYWWLDNEWIFIFPVNHPCKHLGRCNSLRGRWVSQGARPAAVNRLCLFTCVWRNELELRGSVSWRKKRRRSELRLGNWRGGRGGGGGGVKTEETRRRRGGGCAPPVTAAALRVEELGLGAAECPLLCVSPSVGGCVFQSVCVCVCARGGALQVQLDPLELKGTYVSLSREELDRDSGENTKPPRLTSNTRGTRSTLSAPCSSSRCVCSVPHWCVCVSVLCVSVCRWVGF